MYTRSHYINGSLIKKDEKVYTNLLNQFLYFGTDILGTSFFSFKYSYQNVNNHLDILKVKTFNFKAQPKNTKDCLRFNAVTNRSVELFKASSILDYLLINFNNFYREDISENEYNNYTFLPDNNGVVFFLFLLRITL